MAYLRLDMTIIALYVAAMGLTPAPVAVGGAVPDDQQQTQATTLKAAPAFEAKASDGKTYSLKSLTGDKTLVLYFIQSTCPVNAEAFKYYERIAASYKDSKTVRFVGVIDEDAAGYKEWNKDFKPSFPVLYDKVKAIIRSYGAVASPWVIVVSPKGELGTVQKGYSAARLNELNALVATAAGVKAAKIDTKGAPASEAFG